MQTLIINGSPRPGGDTVSLLRHLMERLDGEVRVVDAYRSGISGCMDCRYCWKKPGCALKDGMQELYPFIESCDNVLIASPVYFSEVTGPVLMLGSRLQTYYTGRRFRHEKSVIKPKKGAVILVGGGDGSPEKAYGTAHTLLKVMGVKEFYPLVGSFHTDEVPAMEDAAAVEGVEEIAAFFGGRLLKKPSKTFLSFSPYT